MPSIHNSSSITQNEFTPEIFISGGGIAIGHSISDELVGTIFADRYQILELIGQGGIGKVYRAFDTKRICIVAIKVMRPDLASNPSTLAQFQKEVQVACRLRHSNIAFIYDLGLLPRPYLVSDYLDGLSLSDLLEKKRHLGMNRSLRIFQQIFRGMEYAHSYGVIHRDLKPGNIMLVCIDGEPDIVKIVDFGVAEIKNKGVIDSLASSLTRDFFGSPLYVSPEQCLGNPTDSRSDIYSLGCLMYRTLTGFQPIIGQSMKECITNHIFTVPKYFEEICPELNIPKQLEMVIRTCMAKEKEDRFQSIREISQTLSLFSN